jgi:hypothetical protein
LDCLEPTRLTCTARKMSKINTRNTLVDSLVQSLPPWVIKTATTPVNFLLWCDTKFAHSTVHLIPFKPSPTDTSPCRCICPLSYSIERAHICPFRCVSWFSCFRVVQCPPPEPVVTQYFSFIRWKKAPSGPKLLHEVSTRLSNIMLKAEPGILVAEGVSGSKCSRFWIVTDAD